MRRLKSRVQFQAVLAGQRVASTSHFVLHRCVLDAGAAELEAAPALDNTKPGLFPQNDVWLGAMVPKRWAKRAVTRNAIKRQIYNVSSRLESALPVAAHVVRLRSGFDKAGFPSATSLELKMAVRAELEQLFLLAGKGLATTRFAGQSR